MPGFEVIGRPTAFLEECTQRGEDTMQAANQPNWQLARGQTLHRVTPQARLLRVRRGRLWVTRDGRLDAPAEDMVLARGETLLLPRGADVVLEAFEDAAFEWLEPAPC
jgi:Protein of unknown function (DUF2917)/Cupin